MKRHALLAALLGSSILQAAPVFAQSRDPAAPAPGQSQPQPLPMPPPIAAPKDVPFPGTMTVHVDATDLDRHIMTIHQTIPVPADAAEKGEMVLLFPMWVPGDHSPTGVIRQFAGLNVRDGGKTVTWTRDVVDVAAFHVPVTKGSHTLDIDFKLLTPVSDNEGRVVMTPTIVNVQWNQVSLYPAGYFTRQIHVTPSLTLPHGWTYGTALRPQGTTHAAGSGDATTFQSVTYNTLVDSPLYGGRYGKRVEIDDHDGPPVYLDLFADKPESIAATPEQIEAHRNLVRQATLTFGSHHYDHYDFLLALTDELGGIGLEHHRSSENSADPGYFTKWDHTFPERDLLAHEYTHSWNGKYRRPADLWAPNFNTPERDSLLWVYEGQTQFWGNVLAARSGLVTKQQGFDALAEAAAGYDQVAGRTWRPLQDTTNDPTIAQRSVQSWRSFQRSEDYYVEGQLVWLDADSLIRQLSHDTKSIDDFAKAFFGTNDGSYVVSPYRFEDVVAALNAVQPYDWAKFLRDRLDHTGVHAPLDGLARDGWRLVFTDKPSSFAKALDSGRHAMGERYSLGLIVGHDGTIKQSIWGSPAFDAGLTRDEKILAVNGETFSGEGLTDAITSAHAPGAGPITLVIKDGTHIRTVSIPYHGGLRYPSLERIPNTPDRLSTLYAPRH